MNDFLKLWLPIGIIACLTIFLLPVALAIAFIGGGETACAAKSENNYLLGDSIGVGLTSYLPGYTIQATGGITLSASFSKVEADKEKISAADNVVIELGTNTNPTEVKSFPDDAEKMVKQIRSYNKSANIFWVEIFSKGAPGYQDTAKEYYAKQNKVISQLNDVTMIATKDAGINVPDGLHPDAAGYKKLAELIEDAVAKGGTAKSTPQPSESCDPEGGGSGGGSGGDVMKLSGDALRKAFLAQENITYQVASIQDEVRTGKIADNPLRAVLAAAREKGMGNLAVSAGGCASHSNSGGLHCPTTPSQALDIGTVGTDNIGKLNEFLCNSAKKGNPYKIQELFGYISDKGCVVNGGKPGGGNPDPPNHVHLGTSK